MSTLRIAHFADLHYCAKHLKWVDRAFGYAIDHAIKNGAEAAVIAGDSFDAAINLHEPAVTAFFAKVKRLADAMPVLVLQGTFSHDRPGSLSPLRAIGPRVTVADSIHQAVLSGSRWILSEAHAARLDKIPNPAQALFSCLPSINKGGIAAVLGAECAAEKAGETVLTLCNSWAPINLQARAMNIPTILVSHGTVNGCITETARAMVSPDHEFTTGALFSAKASAVMLGHIHAHQSWQESASQIAYPGSLTKMIYGHKGDTGYLLWDVGTSGASFIHIPCPSRDMIEAEFNGAPDLESLADIARQSHGAYVRIRYSIDEEHRGSVDQDAIRALFANAEEVRIEARVNPIQRVRAAGISQSPTLADKLRGWCEVTDTDPEPLLERLIALQGQDPAKIAEGVTTTMPRTTAGASA